MLKLVSKSKATWSVFAIQKVTFNRKKVPNILDTSDVTEIGAVITEKPKTSLKKIRSEKIKTTIEVAIILTKLACKIEI